VTAPKRTDHPTGRKARAQICAAVLGGLVFALGAGLAVAQSTPDAATPAFTPLPDAHQTQTGVAGATGFTVSGAPGEGADPFAKKVETALMAEPSAVTPGEPFWVGFHMDITEGWHTYWRNPGDSGEPPRIEWQLPAGFSISELKWPVPERQPYGPFMNFGYSGAVTLLAEITPPADLAADRDITIHADASWLVCADICIPEDESHDLTLPAGPANFDALPSADAPTIRAAHARTPKIADFDMALEAGENGREDLRRGLPFGVVVPPHEHRLLHDRSLLDRVGPRRFRHGLRLQLLQVFAELGERRHRFGLEDPVALLACEPKRSALGVIGVVEEAAPARLESRSGRRRHRAVADHAGRGRPPAPACRHATKPEAARSPEIGATCSTAGCG